MPIIGRNDKNVSRAAAGAAGPSAASVEKPVPATSASTADYIPPAAALALAPLRSESTGAVEHARQLTITTPAAYDAAGRFVVETIRAALARIDEALKGPVADAHALHKKLVAVLKKEREPWEEAERVIEDARRVYRRKVQEHQESLRRQLEAEHQRAAELAARQTVRALVEQGDDEKAKAITQALVTDSIVPATPLPAQVYKPPKTAGTSVTKKWKYRMVDESKVVRAFLVPDEKAIRVLVEKQGPKAVGVVGEGSIEVYQDEVESFRRTPS